VDDYDRLCDFGNLYAAHIKTRRSKRCNAEVIRFEVDLARNLLELSCALRSGEYRPNKYYHFKVFEPKERDIHALRYPDRVVQRCLCDQVLAPLLERHLIYDNAACQKGKGTHFSLNRLSGFLRSHFKQYGRDGYVLKCDVRHYFASISHDRLKTRLARLFVPGRMREFWKPNLLMPRASSKDSRVTVVILSTVILILCASAGCPS
jgi:hypothetical protein